MDTTVIMQAISTLGFPVSCSLYLLYYNNKLNENHRNEISRLSEIINNNTIALTQLTERMKSNEKDKD